MVDSAGCQLNERDMLFCRERGGHLQLEERVETLESQLSELNVSFSEFRKQFD